MSGPIPAGSHGHEHRRGRDDPLDPFRMFEKFSRTRRQALERVQEQVLERHLVQNARVHLNSGHGYGKGSDFHMRMNVGTSRKTLELALKHAETVMPGLRPTK